VNASILILRAFITSSLIIALAACTRSPISAPGATASSLIATPTIIPTIPTEVPQEQAILLTSTPTRLSTSPSPLLTPSPGLSPTPETIPLPSPPQNRTHYELNATLDYAGHSLAVEEVITYTNTTPERLSSIPLVIEALRYPRTFQLAGLFDQNGKRLSYHDVKDTALTLTLPQTLAPGATTHFSASYSLALTDVHKLPQLRPYPLGYTSVQANFGDWYPFIPPYILGTGWLVHPPTTYGEHLVYDIADFDVAIRLSDARDNLVFAAPVPESTDREWRRYHQEAARSFAWSASPFYQEITQTVPIAGDQVAIIASYYFAYHEKAGKSLLDSMARALPLYSHLFGAYPHPMLVGVQADFVDGMEYDGLFFLSTDYYNWHKDSQADFVVALAAHETAHQWWYGLVGSDQAMQPWLDEALCTYSERLYYENFSPGDLNWWWTYRINYYEPKGWVDVNIYEVPGVAGAYSAYREPVYLRGALFLEDLRTLMGDQAFFGALRAYVQSYAYRQADAAGFLAILQQHTTSDLMPVLSKYLSLKIK
jgi:hypothetical protein